MKLERKSNDQVELLLSDNPDDFAQLAEVVKDLLKGKWLQQLNGLDQSYWDLIVDGQILTCHREHFLGVSVFCIDNPQNRELLENLKTSLEKVR